MTHTISLVDVLRGEKTEPVVESWSARRGEQLGGARIVVLRDGWCRELDVAN